MRDLPGRPGHRGPARRRPGNADGRPCSGSAVGSQSWLRVSRHSSVELAKPLRSSCSSSVKQPRRSRSRGRRSTRPRSISEFASPARRTRGRFAARSMEACNTMPLCRRCRPRTGGGRACSHPSRGGSRRHRSGASAIRASPVCTSSHRPIAVLMGLTGKTGAGSTRSRCSSSLKRSSKPIRERTYLTGHSMGGHGTWHLGVTFPDRFAAIAPSAGWISMWSYAGARRTESPSPVEELMAPGPGPERYAGAVAEPQPSGCLHPPRRCRRQRAGRPGPADAAGAR